jgi:hypothetical protein
LEGQGCAGIACRAADNDVRPERVTDGRYRQIVASEVHALCADCHRYVGSVVDKAIRICFVAQIDDLLRCGEARPVISSFDAYLQAVCSAEQCLSGQFRSVDKYVEPANH